MTIRIASTFWACVSKVESGIPNDNDVDKCHNVLVNVGHGTFRRYDMSEGVWTMLDGMLNAMNMQYIEL